MIPFKYKGYNIKIRGTITPDTSQVKFSFSNETDDNNHVLIMNTNADKQYHNVVNKIKRSVDDRLRYLEQTKAS